nr:hypothetical protein CDS [Bradyrhizobium sp.]
MSANDRAHRVRPKRSARSEIRPRQREANIVKVVVSYPQLVRSFRQGRKLARYFAQERRELKTGQAQQFGL